MAGPMLYKVRVNWQGGKDANYSFTVPPGLARHLDAEMLYACEVREIDGKDCIVYVPVMLEQAPRLPKWAKT